MNRKKRNIIRVSFLLVAAAVFILLRAALYDGLTVGCFTVSSSAVKESHTFAVITDLHSTYYGEDQSELCELIDKYSPEAIFLVTRRSGLPLPLTSTSSTEEIPIGWESSSTAIPPVKLLW